MRMHSLFLDIKIQKT